MPGCRCAVATCNNSLDVTKNLDKHVLYHRFPKNADIERIWVQRCSRADRWDSKFSRVCSEHFTSNDYQGDLKAELLNLTAKKRLKETAVPSLLLPKTTYCAESNITISDRSKRLEQRIHKATVEKLLEVEQRECVIITSQNETKFKEVCIQTDNCCLQEKYNNLLKKYEEAVISYDNLKKQTNTILTQQKGQIKTMQNTIKKTEVKMKYYEKMEKCIGKMLSNSQMDLLFKRKKIVRWTPEDISKAFTIRYFSLRCYVYLKESLNYPLPGISSLQRWASKIDLTQGLLLDILRIMNIAGESMSEFEKIVVLQYDEIKVASLYEFDKMRDKVVGPHQQMQVVMARGLFGKWKQPVYIGFDQRMTKQILHEIISKLHEIKYTVVACVSDCGASNVGLWKELNVSVQNTFFLHPVTEEHVYMFADAPHLLKLVRNWFLDTGFTLEDGTKISKQPVVNLIKSTDSEVNSCHKLRSNHVECKNTERQNVSLAAQLLSHTTATALKHYYFGPQNKLARDTGNFIENIASWFDIMNSYSITANVNSKKPYGLSGNFDEQNEKLDEMYNTILKMRCVNKASLQIFQKGILISINSLKSLFSDMKNKYDAKYILTHKLNQDSLENFFSQVRTRGGLHDHPSPLNAIYRIRMIILGKNPGIIQKNVNTVDAFSDEYLVAQVFVKSQVSPESDLVQETQLDNNSDPDSFSLSMSSSYSSESINENSSFLPQQSEDDGLMYLAGWIARKFKGTYPDLGDFTYKSKNEHDYSMPSWIQHLSFGGLTEPSKKWSNQIRILDKLFKKFHGNTFKKEKGISDRLVKIIINRKLDLPKAVIDSSFCSSENIYKNKISESKEKRNVS